MGSSKAGVGMSLRTIHCSRENKCDNYRQRAASTFAAWRAAFSFTASSRVSSSSFGDCQGDTQRIYNAHRSIGIARRRAEKKAFMLQCLRYALSRSRCNTRLEGGKEIAGLVPVVLQPRLSLILLRFAVGLNRDTQLPCQPIAVKL
eukprot:6182233-Pleurochrysis_carterae.AAC.3